MRVEFDRFAILKPVPGADYTYRRGACYGKIKRIINAVLLGLYVRCGGVKPFEEDHHHHQHGEDKKSFRVWSF